MRHCLLIFCLDKLNLENAEFPQTRTVTHHHGPNTLFYFRRVHNDRWDEIKEYMIAICATAVWVGKGHFQLIHGFQQQSFA